jgi:cation transport ATPase
MKSSHSESQAIHPQIAGMDCPDRIEELRWAFAGHAGITDLSFNLMRATMTVEFDSSATDTETVISIVRTTGMSTTPASDRAASSDDQNGGE